jgi:hypothetical protein
MGEDANAEILILARLLEVLPNQGAATGPYGKDFSDR